MAAPTFNLPPCRIASKRTLGEFFEVNASTVENWATRGMPILARDRQGWTIDLLEVAKWRFIPNHAKPDDEFDPEKLAPKQRLEWYQGTKAALELKQREGQLILAEDAEEKMAAVIKGFVQFLETLPDILERDANLTGAQVERMNEIIDLQREQLYAQLRGENAE